CVVVTLPVTTNRPRSAVPPLRALRYRTGQAAGRAVVPPTSSCRFLVARTTAGCARRPQPLRAPISLLAGRVPRRGQRQRHPVRQLRCRVPSTRLLPATRSVLR